MINYWGRLSLVVIIGLINNSAQAQKQKAADIKFKKHILTTEFVSEGVTVFDVNKDGKKDVIAGGYWFEAPQWDKHEVIPPKTFDGKTGYSDSFLNFNQDVNQDGWTDLIVVGFPGQATFWYENPKNKVGHWTKHLVYHSIGNESPAFVDVDNDGRKDLIGADSEGKKVVWVKSPSKKDDTTWTAYPISAIGAEGTHMFTHGLGYGDVNKDGLKDIIIRKGWWQGPVDPKQKEWVFHPSDLGEDCSQMHILDIDKDGDNDVLSCSAHTYGIWWHEQLKDNSGKQTWKTHQITKAFSQTHSSSLADINKDGFPDLVTGKRYFAHMGNDPGEYETPLLVWFEFKPGKNPQWIQHEIDNDSGSGLNVITEDITKDKLIDVIVANKKGVFVFEQLKK